MINTLDVLVVPRLRGEKGVRFYPVYLCGSDIFFYLVCFLLFCRHFFMFVDVVFVFDCVITRFLLFSCSLPFLIYTCVAVSCFLLSVGINYMLNLPVIVYMFFSLSIQLLSKPLEDFITIP